MKKGFGRRKPPFFFAFAVRGGKRQFSLAETCQPVHFSTPRFLAAQRSAVSSRREEIAQRKPLKGFPLDSFRNRGAAAPLAPRAARHEHVTNRACLRTFEYSLVEGYDKLGRPDSAQSKFPLEISLRGGGCVLCDEDPRPPSQPARKDFCRAKMPCDGQSVTNLLLGRKIVRYFTNQ